MNELKGCDTQAPLKELYYSSAQMSAAKTISTDQVKKLKYSKREFIDYFLDLAEVCPFYSEYHYYLSVILMISAIEVS